MPTTTSANRHACLKAIPIQRLITQVRVAQIAEIYAQVPSDQTSWLSASEQARFSRLKVPSRMQAYVSGHWLTRQILSAQFGGAPQHWRLEERMNLPPAVIAAPVEMVPIELSISHSGDWIACAISDAAIGIDIEQRQDRAGLLRFQELLLAVGEAPDTVNLDELLLRWVAKEAWIKRHHGSALPEQLKALELHPANANTANVQIISTACFHLAMSAIRPVPIDFAPTSLTTQRYFLCRANAGTRSASLATAPAARPG